MSQFEAALRGGFFFVKLDERQLSIVTQIAIGAAILAVAVRFHEGDPSRI
jgi:hypothetical protein